MSPERRKKIGGKLVEEFYWAGALAVYVDHHAVEGTFDDVCKELELQMVMEARQIKEKFAGVDTSQAEIPYAKGGFNADERVLERAQAESDCESVAVGGLAVDMGFPVVTPPDFKCTECGAECPISDPVEGAICEEHCGDHNYEYDRGERKWSCVHCDKERPYDW